MAQPRVLKQVSFKKGTHSYSFMKVSREGGGAFYMATRDKGRVKFFNSVRDMANHYTSLRSEITKAFKE